MEEYNRFGSEWSRYPEIISLYEKQFLAWVAPLQPADFAGKTILDAGCGTGRNSLWPLQYGASHVTAFDVDPRTVAVAKGNLASSPNATVLQRSIYEIEFRNSFDIVLSIGVIHHLADPRRAVANLVHAAKPGGIILIWVYGSHGYAWVKRMINAMRKVTSRIGPGTLRWLVYPFSAILFGCIKLFPSRHPYFALLKTASFWHVHSIVYDQFLPEIANYWTKQEVVSLFQGLPVASVTARDCNAGSWTVIAQKEPS